MSTKNDGGPAFPCGESYHTSGPGGSLNTKAPLHPGMSLREWFAGQALNGTLGLLNSGPLRLKEGGSGPITETHVAETAVAIADALIAELNKPISTT